MRLLRYGALATALQPPLPLHHASASTHAECKEDAKDLDRYQGGRIAGRLENDMEVGLEPLMEHCKRHAQGAM